MLKFKLKGVYPACLMLLLLTACSHNPPSPAGIGPGNFTANLPDNHKATGEEELRRRLLENEYLFWKGTPYRLGGSSKKGIDCSALVQAVYRKSFKIDIARTVKKQSRLGFFVARKTLKTADLLFFKINRKVLHVGIYLGHNQFLHASTTKGVMISALNNSYWRRKYWQARRIL